MLKVSIIIGLLLIFNVGFCMGQISEQKKKGGNMTLSINSDNNTERYKNASIAPSYLSIRLKDSKTGKIVKLIVENEDLASFLANKHGLEIDKKGRFKDFEAYRRFIEDDYVNFMIENEGKVLDIDLEDFIEFIGKSRFGSKKSASEYLTSFIFESPITFEQLNVQNEKEFLDTYFDFDSSKKFGSLKREYYKKYNSNSGFIALLINLRYEVTRGDIAPVLNIRIR